MPTLKEVQRNWDGFARDDPLWAILVQPFKEGNRWDLDEFFSTGVDDVAAVLAHLDATGHPIAADAAALDFGCGVGRITQPLARRVGSCVGVDISPVMIERARSFNRIPERCSYLLNDAPDLAIFDDASFDFVFSTAVLQHIAPRHALRYVAEMVRVLRPGGVLFLRVQDRRGGAGYALLHGAWRLHRNVGLRTRLRRLWARARRGERQPPMRRMEMFALEERRVRAVVSRGGGRIAESRATGEVLPMCESRYASLASRLGWGLYCREYVVARPRQAASAQGPGAGGDAPSTASRPSPAAAGAAAAPPPAGRAGSR